MNEAKEPEPEAITADDVAKIAKEVEKDEESKVPEKGEALGQYSGATLDGGDARMSKFARYNVLKQSISLILFILG